jgi:hypothetical protein
MGLQESDIDFLIRGSYGLRYVTRPELVEAHRKPEGVHGDAYSLSGLHLLLNDSEKQGYPVPFAASLANKGVLGARLEDAIGEIVDGAVNNSPDQSGQGVTFILLRNVQKADSPYDFGPGYPTGKCGKQHIDPSQVVSFIRLDDTDLLEAAISKELGDKSAARNLLTGKIVDGITQMRENAPAAKAVTQPKPAIPTR